MYKLLLILLLSLTLCNNLYAHQEKLITCENGELIGLPADYQPAKYDQKSKRLRIKNNVINISQSKFLSSLFLDNLEYDFHISASWYHQLSILPPYMVFHIDPTQKDYSYNILFDMDTLEVIELSVILKVSSTVTRDFRVKTLDIQKDDINDAIQRLNEN